MFTLSDQQRAISDTATRFGAEHLTPFALQWEQDRHLPVEVLREAGRLKMGGLHVGPDVGGQAVSRVDAALVVEGVATGCPAIAGCLSNHNTAAWMIDTYGDRGQRYRWLPGLCALTELAVYCIAEAGTGSDVAGVRATAARDGDHYVISGVKNFVPAAGSADVYIVIARTAQSGTHGLSAFVIDRDDAGLSFGAGQVDVGWNARPTGQVVLNGVRVTADRRLGAEGDGFRVATSAVNGGRLHLAACSLGGAKAALNRSFAQLRGRSTTAGILLLAAAVQLQLADMTTELEAARTLLWRAAATLDAANPDADRLCAMAKILATDAGSAVTDRALQLHRGAADSGDGGIDQIARDLELHRTIEGSNDLLRVLVARTMTGAG